MLIMLFISLPLMAKEISSLSALLPLIYDRHKFHRSANEGKIKSYFKALDDNFKSSDHQRITPSFSKVLKEFNLARSYFEHNKKGLAQWKLREISHQCISCHSKDISTENIFFKDQASLGLYQVLLERYTDAKENFSKMIEKDPSIMNYKQFLLIEVRLGTSPEELDKFFQKELKKKKLPKPIINKISEWKTGLDPWKNNIFLTKELTSDSEAETLIKQIITPLKERISINNSHDLLLLYGSTLLAQYIDRHPDSPSSPELRYWLGWSTKCLRKAGHYVSEEYIFKECILKYTAHPMARKCFEEYKQTLEEKFLKEADGILPREISKEIQHLASILSSSI